MKELQDKELLMVVGGINITSSIMNSFVNAIEIALEVGRSFGTAIRRITGKGICVIR